MSSSLAHQDNKQRAGLLLAIALASMMLWQTALGSFLLHPFTILATWFHEMGHGIAAILTSSRFDRVLIFPDGSGVAQSLRSTNGNRLTDALIAASGPLGPAIARAALIIASRRQPARPDPILKRLGASRSVRT